MMMRFPLLFFVVGSGRAEQEVQLKRVSIRDFVYGRAEERAAAVSNLRQAFENEGMALIVDSGVPLQVIQDCMERSREFFALPLEIKQEYKGIRSDELPPRSYASPSSPIGRSYDVQAQTDSNQIINEWLQFRETRDWSIEEEAEYYNNSEGREHYSHNSEYGLPKDWPNTHIAQATRQYYTHIYHLTTIMNDLFGEALAEISRHTKNTLFSDASKRVPWWPVTVAHYPPTPEKLNKMRIPAHWDRSLFALIAVDDVDDGRLEILVDAKSGQAADARSTSKTVWRQIEAVPPGAFVLNSGELMTRWTNGKFKHVVHRVPTPSTAATTEEHRGRIAVMAYVMPDYDAIVDCAVCGDDERRLYESSWVGELTNWGSSLSHYNHSLQDDMLKAQALYSTQGPQEVQKVDAVPTDVNHLQDTTRAIIPTINISALFANSHETKAVAEEVSAAFKKFGFAIITGHGVSSIATEKLRQKAYEFFASSEKVNYDKRQGYGHGGYVRSQESGAQLLGDFSKPVDIVESLSLPALSFSNESQQCENEEVPPMLQNASREFLEQSRSIALALAQALALGLNISWTEINTVSDVHASSGLRLAHYWDDANPLPGQLRYGAHVDSGGLTLLSLDPSNPGGLQIYTGSDMEASNPELWLDVPYVPNSFVVNVGALLSRWTRKSWRAVIHRVLPTPGSRLSVVTSAFSPRLDAPAFGAFSTEITRAEDQQSDDVEPVFAKDFLSVRAKLHRPTFAQEQGLNTVADLELESIRIRSLHK